MTKNVDPFEILADGNEAEVRRRLEEFDNRSRAEEAALRAAAKPLEELVVSAYFNVDDVVGESYATSFTPNSEMRCSGPSPCYAGGYTSRLVLKVTPHDPEIPVKKLTFDGISAVRAGDYVSALIPKYEEKEMFEREQNVLDDERRTLYVDRAFKEEEVAIELRLFEYGRVLRTDRAVTYRNFVKE